MYGLGQMMMGGSAADGAPQPGAQGIDLGMLLAQMLKGMGGGQQMPPSPLGQAMGGAGGGAAGGIPPQLLAMLSGQLGK